MVLFGILGLFLLQLFRVQWFIGGLTGSLLFRWVNLLDVFAFAEISLASRSLTWSAFYSAALILGFYLILGRVFCGWACPLDLIFMLINRIKKFPLSFPSPLREGGRVGVRPGSLVALGILLISSTIQIPFFTAYLSPITNCYRTLFSGFFWAAGFPAELAVIGASALILLGFLLGEFFWPHYWCQHLCPVGKTYGLFNRVSLLRLEFTSGECLSCSQCERVCYLGVKILPFSAQKKIRDSSCILCGRCVEACAAQGKILKMRFGP